MTANGGHPRVNSVTAAWEASAGSMELRERSDNQTRAVGRHRVRHNRTGTSRRLAPLRCACSQDRVGRGPPGLRVVG